MNDEIEKPFGRFFWTTVFCLFWYSWVYPVKFNLAELLELIIPPIIIWKLWGFLWLKWNPDKIQKIKYKSIVCFSSGLILLIYAVFLFFKHSDSGEYIGLTFSLIVCCIISFGAGKDAYKELTEKESISDEFEDSYIFLEELFEPMITKMNFSEINRSFFWGEKIEGNYNLFDRWQLELAANYFEEFYKDIKLKVVSPNIEDVSNHLANIFIKNQKKFLHNKRFLPKNEKPYHYSKYGPLIENIPNRSEIIKQIKSPLDNFDSYFWELDFAENFFKIYTKIQNKFVNNIYYDYSNMRSNYMPKKDLRADKEKFNFLKKYFKDELNELDKSIKIWIKNYKVNDQIDIRRDFVDYLFLGDSFSIYFKHSSSKNVLEKTVVDIDDECNPIVLIDGIETCIVDYDFYTRSDICF